MLRTMTAEQMDEWIAFYRLEPFGVEMWDWLIAHFKALFANANRDTKKKKKGFGADDFLCFGKRKREVTRIDEGLEEGTDDVEKDNGNAEQDENRQYPVDGN